MATNEMETMAAKLSEAIENNADDTPHLSIDPESGQMAAIGDPNKIAPRPADYTLVFSYRKDEILESEISKYKFDEKTRTYLETITFKDRRISPFKTARIEARLTKILADIGVVLRDGYDSNVDVSRLGNALIDNTDAFIQLICDVVEIPEEQVKHLMPLEMLSFLNQLLENEPNIIGECSNFLSFSPPLLKNMLGSAK